MPYSNFHIAAAAQDAALDSSALEELAIAPDTQPKTEISVEVEVPVEVAQVERYGVIAGYPDGTYRGNRAMTRYEFAAGLNAALDRVNELIAAGLAEASHP